MQLPEGFAVESPQVERGSVWVRVVDASGQVVTDLPVRMGIMREGERLEPREARTNQAGVAIFSGLETGSHNAYRASIENGAAKFSSDPFQLPTTNAGYQVQLVRMDVSTEPRGVLVTDARVEIGFQDDRIVVIQRMAVVNVTALSMDGTMPHPTTWTPAEPLRFSLPAGASAFRADEQTMGDQRVEEQNGSVLVRGSFPPTDPRQPIQLVWQSRVKIQGSDVPIDLVFPQIPVLAATIVAQGPPGMILEATGFPVAEERVHNGQRVLITGKQRATREDPVIDALHIRLRRIPSSTGPEREAISLAALALALLTVVQGVRRSRANALLQHNAHGPIESFDPAVLAQKLEQIVREIQLLVQEHQAGEVGPETYARQRKQLAIELARVKQALQSAQTKV
jgi:hypothetical protein